MRTVLLVVVIISRTRSPLFMGKTPQPIGTVFEPLLMGLRRRSSGWNSFPDGVYS